MSVDLSGILQGISKRRDTKADLLLRALCQAEFGGLTKWIIWPLSQYLFPIFFLFVCAELLQKEQEFEHLPDVLTQLISPTTHRFRCKQKK